MIPLLILNSEFLTERSDEEKKKWELLKDEKNEKKEQEKRK